MMDAYNTFRDELLTKLSRVGAVDDFRKMVLGLADATARSITAINMDQRQVDELRGQLSFCYRLADDAEKALILQQANANGQH